MTISPVSFTVHAAPLLATYTANIKHKVGETSATAINIGNLEQQGSVVSVTDKGTTSGVQTLSFTLNAGDNAYISPSFLNGVDQVSTDIQLLDSQNNVIADSQAADNTPLKIAYNQLISTGLAPGAGNYTVQATPGAYVGAPDISVNVLQQQGTSLSVNSTLNTTQPADYYNFSLSGSNNIKLAFDSNASTSATDIQLVDSTGHIVADNHGTTFQQTQFNQLIAGEGLTASSGNYQIKVSYAAGTTPTDNGLKYNFQLYSGSSYAVVDQTNAAAPSAASISAAASVHADSRALSFGQTAFHTLNETAQTGVSIGFLQQNKSTLNVTSLLTAVDSKDYFNFVLQKGSTNLKLSLSNLTNKTNTSAVHLQILDNTGAKVIADNQGTSAQKAAFAQLTSSSGLTTPSGTYVVKATYGQGAAKSEKLAYNFQLYSGTSYSAVYRTTASAQTYQNAVINGNVASNYSAAAAAASYINGVANGSITDIISALQTIA